jgi:hypothetical protein
MALTTAQIQQAYVAFFNRPADVAGLNYWSQYEGSLGNLYATFAQQPEYAATFDGLTSLQKVNAVYLNLLSRAPDLAGLEYWALQLDTGAITLANLSLAIIAGAQGSDIETLENKVAAATAFTNALDTTEEALGYTTPEANAAARDWLTDVTDDASLAAAIEPAALDTAIAAVVVAGGTLPGETFLLTTEMDQVEILTVNTADVVKGMINDDGTDDNDTLNAGDSIIGNGNTVLQLAIVDADSTQTEYVEMSGVVKLDIVAAGETGTFSADASTWGSDISEVSLRGADNLDVSICNMDMASTMSINIADGVTGTVNISGSQDGWYVTACISNEASATWSMVGDIALTAFAGDDGTAWVSATQCVSESGTTAAVIGDVVLGTISLEATGNGSAYADFALCAVNTDSGDATVGNMTVGDITLSTDLGGYGSVEIDQCACADTGNATIGDMTVGDVSLMGTGSMSISHFACVSQDGDATVGNMTVGNITNTITETSTYQGIYINNIACVGSSGSGDATAGNISVGDIAIDIAGSSCVSSISMDNCASNNGVGDATVGDITMGNVTAVMADTSSCVCIYQSADARADDGNAMVGNITAGNLDVTMGEEGCFYFTQDACACAASTGNATVGNVTVGDISVMAASGAQFTYCLSAVANASTSGDGVVGDITVGDITADLALSASLCICVSVDASGTGALTAIGNVSIGSVTVGGALALDAYVDMGGSLWSSGDIGSYTVGDVAVTLLDGGDFYYDHFVCASGDVGQVTIGDYDINVGEVATMELDVSGDNVAGVTVGNLSLMADDVIFYGVSISASGDLGNVMVGNIDLVAATTLTLASNHMWIYASGDIGNVTVGDVTLDSPNAETFTMCVTAGDNIGNVELGDVALAAADNFNFYGYLTVDGGADVGDVTVGDISAMATATTASGFAGFYLCADANTADTLGAVTVGNIDLSGVAGTDSGCAWASFSATIGATAGTVGQITLGDITLSGTNENVAAAQDTGDDWAGAGVYISADQGATVAGLAIGDIDITLTNSVDDSTAFATASAYNVVYGSLYADLDADVSVGNISIATVLDSTVDVESDGLLFCAVVDLDADGGDITIGDITVSGGASDTASNALDNLATLSSWLVLTTTGDITVGDIDYSGYDAAASIDVSGYAGAANIMASAGGTVITVNTTQNMITLGAGDDTVVYADDEDSGTTYADIDMISGFDAGDDTIDLSFATGTTVEVAGAVADYATFLTLAANAVDFLDAAVFAMNDGDNTYVAVDSNDDQTIDFVIQLTGVTTVTAGDFTL